MSLNELARLMHGGDCFVSEYGRLKGDLSPKSKLYFGLFAVVKFRGVMHRRRSGWTSGGTHGERRRWVHVEWDSKWGGVSPLQPTKGSGGASWAPPAGSGAEPRPAPAENGFWRILKATERSFLYLYDKIWGTICISVPPLQILGGLVPPMPPRDLRPWSNEWNE